MAIYLKSTKPTYRLVDGLWTNQRPTFYFINLLQMIDSRGSWGSRPTDLFILRGIIHDWSCHSVDWLQKMDFTEGWGGHQWNTRVNCGSPYFPWVATISCTYNLCKCSGSDCFQLQVVTPSPPSEHTSSNEV